MPHLLRADGHALRRAVPDGVEHVALARATDHLPLAAIAARAARTA